MGDLETPSTVRQKDWIAAEIALLAYEDDLYGAQEVLYSRMTTLMADGKLAVVGRSR